MEQTYYFLGGYIMIIVNKQLVLATFATISLLYGLADVQASKSKTKKIRFFAEDGFSLTIPSSLFTLSKVVQAVTSAQKNDASAQQEESIESTLCEKIKFENRKELKLFANALAFIKNKNEDGTTPRLIIQQLSNFFIERHVSKKQALHLLFISEYLQINQLSASLAHFLANTHPIEGIIPPGALKSIQHRLMREHVYATKQNATDFSNFLEIDCFLPPKAKLLPATFNLPEDSYLMSLQKQVEQLWDRFKDNPLCNQLIQQLPPSIIKALLIERIIYINSENPHFDIMSWYIQLPQGRGQGSQRERVLITLRQKATTMVAEQSDATLTQLPEGWFKMEVHRIYHERHGRLIDSVTIDIIEWINLRGHTINLQNMILEIPIKNIIDLLIVHDETHHIHTLLLNGNRLSGEIPAIMGNLTYLKKVNFSDNQLTGRIPPSMGNFRYLQQLDLSMNQLTGTLPETFGNLRNLKKIDLEDNQLSGEIPESFVNLVKLTHLVLSDNQLTINSPASVQILDHLSNRNINPVDIRI